MRGRDRERPVSGGAGVAGVLAVGFAASSIGAEAQDADSKALDIALMA
jgi:hypothetical protein